MSAKLTYHPPVGGMAYGLIQDESGQIIAQVLDIDATGQILAAAPDLLEACCECDEAFSKFYPDPDSRYGMAWAKVEAAIAKATGEGQP